MRPLPLPTSLRLWSTPVRSAAGRSHRYTLAQDWATRVRGWSIWRLWQQHPVDLRTPAEREQAAWEACASEGAEVDWRHIELDGQRYGALYRNGTLIGLLPEAMPPQDHAR